jgi:hypothetical protein
LEELGLADAPAAVEDEHLRAARVGEFLEELELMQAAAEAVRARIGLPDVAGGGHGGWIIPIGIILSSIKMPFGAQRAGLSRPRVNPVFRGTRDATPH